MFRSVARVTTGSGVVLATLLLAGAAVAPPALTARPACSVPTYLPAPPRDRPHETLTLRVLPGLTAVEGKLTIVFAPSSATDRLVFRLWPNSPFYAKRGARLTVGALTSGGRRLSTARPDPTTLVVHRALAAGERISVSMDWQLRLPRTPGLQLHGGKSVRLVSFFPVL